MKQRPLPHIPEEGARVDKTEAPTKVLARAVKELLVLNQRMAQIIDPEQTANADDVHGPLMDWADDLYNEHGFKLEEILRNGKK